MNTPLPTLETVQETFALLDDWEDKYAYIIDLGRKLPLYPQDRQDVLHEVPGCIAKVWMDYGWTDGRLDMRLMSDAEIVKGLLAVLMIAYNDRTADQILAADPKAIFTGLGLETKLSQNRRDGFVAVASRIQKLAQAQG